MNHKIDVPLTQACAKNAAELARTVSESRAWDTAAMMRALVLAETIQGRLGSFISRTRMELGVKDMAPDVEAELALLNEALQAVDDAMNAAHLANSPSQVIMAIEHVQHKLMDGIKQRGGEA